MEYPVLLFIETIESEGCMCVYEDEVNGDKFMYFHGPNRSRTVAICVSDEFITKRTAAALLKQLDLEDLVERMF